MNNILDILKESYFIRKVETKFLELFKLGRISGTVHTCVGQEYTGVLVSKYFSKGDFVVSNHRGHGHYLSITKDLDGLIAELLGKESGISKGVGGSQHLYNEIGFMSNGIQGGMIPIASGIAFANKLKKNNNVAFAFLGDGTLGEGIIYETFNICSKWNLPIIFILENNKIAQSTNSLQTFAGDINSRINGFGLKYFESTIYNLESLDNTLKEAVTSARESSVPCFVNIEVGRLNSHSKGDDNRSEALITELFNKDPLNVFFENIIDTDYKLLWDNEFDPVIDKSVEVSMSDSEFDILNFKNSFETNIDFSSGNYSNINLSAHNNNGRYNDLIYDFFKDHFSKNQSTLIGEDIETNNEFNPIEYGGAFKVTKDMSILFPSFVKNTPISEQAITGIGIGLAISGISSFVEIMFGDFSTLVFDQILQHASKIKLMFGRDLDLPFIIRTPMGGFRGYGPTHSQSIEKHFMGIPGFSVYCLNQFIDPQVVYQHATSQKSPCLIVENKILYTLKKYQNMPKGYKILQCNTNLGIPIIKIIPKSHQPDFTIVIYGGIVNELLLCMETLFVNHEILLEVFIVSDLNNFVIPSLQDSIENTNKLIIVEEGSSIASFSSELIANLVQNNGTSFRVKRIANNFIIPSNRKLENKILPSSERILNEIVSFK